MNKGPQIATRRVLSLPYWSQSRNGVACRVRGGAVYRLCFLTLVHGLRALQKTGQSSGAGPR
jgi:hypothetical protein